MNNKPSVPPLTLSWFIWGLGALFYLAGFFQRVAPGVMTQELMRDFSISASGLGQLSALYFYSYVAMQIPTGILADTLGPRKLLTMGCMVAGAGTLLFSLSSGFIWAGFGRFLIGGSVAVAFVGLLKLSSSWFPKNFYAFVTGNALSIGLIGAIGAGPPLRFLMDIFNWRSVIFMTGLTTLVLGLIIWFIVRDKPQEKGYAGYADDINEPGNLSVKVVWQNLFKVMKYRNTLLLFLIPGGLVGCLLTFSGLWGVPYLISQHGLTPGAAATFTSCLLIGWAVGGPVFGGLSDKFGKRKPLYIWGSIITSTGWLCILFLENLQFYPLAVILCFTGFSSGCIIISFAFVMESVPEHLSGTVSGLTNMGVMMGPMILQPVVGKILDSQWTGGMAEGARIYSLQAYETGFLPMIAWVILSTILLFFTRETHCRRLA